MSNPYLTIEAVQEYTNNWSKLPGIYIDNIFCYETEKEIKRCNHFQLSEESITFIVDTLDQPIGNIKAVSILLGVSKEAPTNVSTLSVGIAYPILQLDLFLPINNETTTYYFHLAFTPSELISAQTLSKNLHLKSNNQSIQSESEGESYKSDSEISIKIAELFILNWQSLSDTEIINAFQAVTPDKISTVSNGVADLVDIQFGAQQMRRVKSYHFDEDGTLGIISNLRSATETNSASTSFRLHMGTGLQVENFYPFNFRPVIEINGEASNSTDFSNYFNTSRPCPPFCPEI